MCEFAHQAKGLKLKHPSDILLNRFLIELNIAAAFFFKKKTKLKNNGIKHNLSGIFQHMPPLSPEK